MPQYRYPSKKFRSTRLIYIPDKNIPGEQIAFSTIEEGIINLFTYFRDLKTGIPLDEDLVEVTAPFAGSTKKSILRDSVSKAVDRLLELNILSKTSDRYLINPIIACAFYSATESETFPDEETIIDKFIRISPETHTEYPPGYWSQEYLLTIAEYFTDDYAELRATQGETESGIQSLDTEKVLKESFINRPQRFIPSTYSV